MKQLLILLSLIFSISCSQERKIIHSDKRSVSIKVNGHFVDWTISPEINPDRLEIYCSKDVNHVNIRTGIDSAEFTIRKNDTIKFRFILNSKDTA